MLDNETIQFDALLDFLESIRKTCIDISLPLAYDAKSVQPVYMCGMFSIVVELAGDSCQLVKARKELASHVLTRALLEAVVELFNVIKNPKYVDVRFQKALIERKKKLIHLQENESEIIAEVGQSPEYVESYIHRINKLRDPEIDQPNIKERFKTAGMEDYYDSAYSHLCDYAHHDASAIINRNIGLDVIPLDYKGIFMLSDLIAELLLNATIAVHEFHDSDQIEELINLKLKWKTIYCQQVAAHGRAYARR